MLGTLAANPTSETDTAFFPDTSSHDDLVDRVDRYRVAANGHFDPTHRAEMGQFLTPPLVARFMASLFNEGGENVQLLDAGAGVGTLTAAFVEQACHRSVKLKQIKATAYEVDQTLANYLGSTLNECRDYCQARGITFKGNLRQTDFIAAGAGQLRADLFAPQLERYKRAILNPPYRKIRSDSPHRILLRDIGVETSNLYAGFLAIVVRLLEPGGELVAITPRSFCNGPYFAPFRKILLEGIALKRVHVFDLRDKAFQDDDVLQENIIFHAVRDGQRDKVIISRSQALDDDTMSLREVPSAQVVHPDDPSLVIHLAANDMDAFVKDRLAVFGHTLDQLGIAVSTGRVVDFRVKEMLRARPESGAAPLIYPAHFVRHSVRWPNPGGRKPEALVVSDATRPLLLPAGNYVLVKRFSAKEEPRRVVAAVLDQSTIHAPAIAFENHLNVYHIGNASLPLNLARGLALYLNSTLVDVYFRQFSGHTQVNASDLRMLTYPDRGLLEQLGARAGDQPRSQREIDGLLEEEMHRMTDIRSPDPVAAKQRVTESLEILKALGLPRGQTNERSALTLLALLGLRPDIPWQDAANPRVGITPIMDFCRDHYGTRYAPNTRETFRRQTMHQFVEACLAVANPDQPDRPINSPKWCYQVEPRAFRLFQTYGTAKWDAALTEWQSPMQGRI